ncbi:MAG: type II toxin-antitoxin system Phd/YefM family antitoxin [Gemmatimonadetes bacterium]|nr:type II toxin-antitoxin system Phd/YefM family antitoxin [Gemmatimonadota bacterium]MDE3256606.1 type II toxin-antitoxin system Phd/YefM family antitoxin [Gemmatimonadota bacterium]
MNVYTYSEARQNFSKVLDRAESTGKVLIRRKDGRTYALVPERPTVSPLDVPSIQADVSTREIVTLIRDQRRRIRGRGRRDE